MRTVCIFTLFSILFLGQEIIAQSENDSLVQFSYNQEVPDSLRLKGNIYDPLFLIKGQVAGASVSKNGGHPGVPHHMIIRGLSSIYFSQNPVYVIDGVIDADMSLIDPDDINSIEVLNNIASSAKYGNLGGNGVVVVKTNEAGSTKPLSLSYKSFISLDQVSNRYDLLSADEIRDYANKLEIEEPYFSFLDGGADIDYQDELFRNSITHSHHLSGSGTIKNTSYFASLFYKNQPGVFENSGSKKYGGNLKIKQTFFNDKLEIMAMANFQQQDVKGIDEFDQFGVLKQTYRHNPTDPVYNNDGSYYHAQRTFSYFNPVEANNKIDNTRTNKQLLSGLQINYNITDNFKLKLNTDYRKFELDQHIFKPALDIPGWNNEYENDITEYDQQITAGASITYSGNIKNAHFFGADAGYQFRNKQAEFIQGRGMKPYEYIVYRREDDDTAIINNSINSFYANFSYNYKHRYFLQAGVRYDDLIPSIERQGTYFTSPEDLAGKSMVYPSITIAWDISNEAFLKNQKWLSKFMISGGYGEAGKENNLYTINNNQEIDFEKSKEYNASLNFGFLKNRITGSFIYYDRTSNDIFNPLGVPVPPNLIGYVHDNSTEVNNKGYEINLLANIINKPDICYSTNFTFSSNKNKITALSYNWSNKHNYITEYSYYSENSYTQLFEEGQSLFAFYLPRFEGAIDNRMIFIREDGGLTDHISNAERVFANTVLPEFELSWGNYFTIYKDFDVSFSLRYINGHSIYKEAKMGLESWQAPTLNALSTTVESEWFMPEVCDFYLEDASYWRLDNIVVSYTFKLKSVNPDCKLKLMIGANNLFTISNYSGLDPEINYNTRYPGVEKANVYPPIRSYFFGLNFTI